MQYLCIGLRDTKQDIQEIVYPKGNLYLPVRRLVSIPSVRTGIFLCLWLPNSSPGMVATHRELKNAVEGTLQNREDKARE